MKDDLVERAANVIAYGIDRESTPRAIAENVLAIARPAILEEAAEVAKTEGVYPELNIFAGGPEWYKHGRRIAARIRAHAHTTGQG